MNSDNIITLLEQNGLDRGFEFIKSKLFGKISPADVERHLRSEPGVFSIERLAALISPAGEGYLEQMAEAAHELTVKRFGQTMQMYAPLYLSNYCINSCMYCGFNTSNTFKRTRLTIEQAIEDAEIIASEGFEHILLVSGEDPGSISVDYLCELASELRRSFSSISVEIYPLDKSGYTRLFKAGIDGVTLYQETYDRDVYKQVHGKGPKSDYDFRLDTHDRCGQAGMRRLGIGVLLGLTNFRVETLVLGVHGYYLMKKYWQSQISFSFPRLRPAENVSTDSVQKISDTNLVQMMLALRLCFADAGIVLSTRESANLRDSLIKLCVTRISAGSKTNPGGYSQKEGGSVKQFEIDDSRSPKQVADVIHQAGLQPVWKDWDSSFCG